MTCRTKLCKKLWETKKDVNKEISDIKKKPITPYQPKFRFTKFLLIIFENLIP